MNTNQIQKFATQARNILIKGVKDKLTLLGFSIDNEVSESDKPRRYTDSTVYRGRVFQGTRFYDQWMELFNRIQLIGFEDVCEEAASTWFNRLVALRILQKNGIIKPVIEFDNPAVQVPRIVSDARRGKYEYITDIEKQQLAEYIDDDSQIFEQFQILITAYCHNHPLMKACFGGITGYTELLLPNNILVDGNFVDLLNNTDYLSDDDYRQSELIGWLYQFYISEKKDEVFASFKDGKKAEADQIPAATQIFTPNWIVKYMVQNTLGRIYLDNHPNSSLKSQWKYLVEPTENSGEKLDVNHLEDLTCADFSCGSGHILGEFFEMLYQIYDEELYDPRQAIESILRKNIIGIDLDTRAKQLSMFALLLKACQKDVSFADTHCLPRVFDMPVVNLYTWRDLSGHMATALQLECANKKISDEIEECFHLMEQANNLGSIMKFNISDETRQYIQLCVDTQNRLHKFEESFKELFKGLELILTLTNKYSAVVMNPPYMGIPTMNAGLSKYIKDNYEIGKADLCTAFILMQAERTIEKGCYANIVPPSWMFLSTFEDFRRNIVDNYSIQSLLHLSRGVFGADFGSVSSVIKNCKNEKAKGVYFRLIDRTFQEFDQRHLRILFEKTLANHDFRYLFTEYSKDILDIVYNIKGSRIYYPSISQSNFDKIPGCPIGYWVSDLILSIFSDYKKLSEYGSCKKGMDTGENRLFIRLWFEVSKKLFNAHYSANNAVGKWVPYRKGGTFRKWFGNNDYVINWENDGYLVTNFPKSNIRNRNLYFKESISWTLLSTTSLSARYYDGGIFDGNSPSFFSNDNKECYLGFLNSEVSKSLLKIMNPTLAFNSGDIANIPYADIKDNDIIQLVDNNISISKSDWDAHETSWDFQKNELINMRDNCRGNAADLDFLSDQDKNELVAENSNRPIGTDASLIEHCYRCYISKWEKLYYQLHANEEELNQKFIEIYGLQDELSPEVPQNEITILQQGEISFTCEPGSDNYAYTIDWNKDVIIKQFISYAVGCIMGRYRLDRPGLNIAHPNPTEEELAPYKVGDGNQQFVIDDDAIIPILPADAPFPDNAANRITDFVKVVFGTETINDNMNFIQNALGQSVADYMTKQFYADHKRTYQNRPIYWLFSSKRGAFQCLVYMHRMNRFTIGRIRDNYLLPYIQHLEAKLVDYDFRAALLSSDERRDQKRTETILKECRDYDNILHLYANKQIEIDLDDGVLHNYELFKDILAKLK